MSEEYTGAIRVPTAEQYAYIELTHTGTLPSFLEAYNAATMMVKVGAGLEPKEWIAALDSYRLKKGLAPDVWEKMNKAQQWMIHEIDKSDGRMAPKILAKKRASTDREENGAKGESAVII